MFYSLGKYSLARGPLAITSVFTILHFFILLTSLCPGRSLFQQLTRPYLQSFYHLLHYTDALRRCQVLQGLQRATRPYLQSSFGHGYAWFVGPDWHFRNWDEYPCSAFDTHELGRIYASGLAGLVAFLYTLRLLKASLFPIGSCDIADKDSMGNIAAPLFLGSA